MRIIDCDYFVVGSGMSGLMCALHLASAGRTVLVTKQRLEELESRRLDLELAIEEEKVEQPVLTRDMLTFWLEKFRTGDYDDPAVRSQFTSRKKWHSFT